MNDPHNKVSPFAALEKRAFGQWINNKVDGAWNGVRDNVVNPLAAAANGVATNAGNYVHDIKQMGSGIADAASGIGKQVVNGATALPNAISGALQGGMDAYNSKGTLGSVLGGAVDGGWNSAQKSVTDSVNNLNQTIGGVKDVAQASVNAPFNALKTIGGAGEVAGRALTAQPMAIYSGIAGAVNAPGATPPPTPAAPAASAPIQPAGPPASAKPMPAAGTPVAPGMATDERMHAQNKLNPSAGGTVAPQKAAPGITQSVVSQHPTGVPTAGDLAKFRQGTASTFDPKSALDRAKMQALMQGNSAWAANMGARGAMASGPQQGAIPRAMPVKSASSFAALEKSALAAGIAKGMGRVGSWLAGRGLGARMGAERLARGAMSGAAEAGAEGLPALQKGLEQAQRVGGKRMAIGSMLQRGSEAAMAPGTRATIDAGGIGLGVAGVGAGMRHVGRNEGREEGIGKGLDAGMQAGVAASNATGAQDGYFGNLMNAVMGRQGAGVNPGKAFELLSANRAGLAQQLLAQ